MLSKKEVLRAINTLPDSFGAVDAIEKIVLLEKIKLGLMLSDAKKVVSKDEAKKRILDKHDRIKTWLQISSEYPDYLRNSVKVLKLRLSALAKIEQFLKGKYPGVLRANTDFRKYEAIKLKESYAAWKGKRINGAESQVFNDFYKLSGLKK